MGDRFRLSIQVQTDAGDDVSEIGIDIVWTLQDR